MHKYVRYSLAAAGYLLAAQFAFLAGIQNPGNPDDFEKARLTDLVAGTGYRPFVYRTLLPRARCRLAERCLPEGVRGRIGGLPDPGRRGRTNPCA